MDEVRYMISEVSKRVEVKDHVLRYWQDKLELPIERNEMGHRYYRDVDIERLKTVKHLMDQGFQLKAIKLLLPNLHKVSSLDDHTMNRLRDELNGKVIDMYRDEDINEETKDEISEEASKDEQAEEVDQVQHAEQADLVLQSEEVNQRLQDEEIGQVLQAEQVDQVQQGEEIGQVQHGEPAERSPLGGTSLITSETESELKEQSSDKVGQFKAIMNHIIMEALKENNATLSEDISTNVTDGVIKEMSFLMRLQEEKEEERYKKFDATVRDYQKSRMMAAVSLDGKSRKKSKFMKKNKVHI